MASKRVVIVAIDGSDHAYDALDWYLSNIHRSGDTVIGVHCADYSKLQSQRKSRRRGHYSLELFHTTNSSYVNDTYNHGPKLLVYK